MNFKAQLEHNAQILQVLQKRMHAVVKEPPHGSRQREACREFHERYDQLAFPDIGLRNAEQRMTLKDPDISEITIQYLEVDPWYHRSGYIKKKICRYLKYIVLTSEQKDRLMAIIEKQVFVSNGVEISVYAKLAGHLQLPPFEEKIYDIMIEQHEIISKHAKRVLTSINYFKNISHAKPETKKY